MQRILALLALAALALFLLILWLTGPSKGGIVPAGKPAESSLAVPSSAQQAPADFFTLARQFNGPVRPYLEQLLTSTWIVLAANVQKSTGANCYQREVGEVNRLPDVPDGLVKFCATSNNQAAAPLADLLTDYNKQVELLSKAPEKGHLEAYLVALGEPRECLKAFKGPSSEQSATRVNQCVERLSKAVGEWEKMLAQAPGQANASKDAPSQTPEGNDATEGAVRPVLARVLKAAKAAAAALTERIGVALLEVTDGNVRKSLHDDLVSFHGKLGTVFPGLPPVLVLAPGRKLIDVYGLFVTQFYEATKEQYDAFLARVRREFGESNDGAEAKLKTISVPLAAEIKTELLAQLKRPEVEKDPARKAQVEAAVRECDLYDEGSKRLSAAIHGDPSTSMTGVKALLGEPLAWLETLDSGVERLKDQSITDEAQAAEVTKGMVRSLVGESGNLNAPNIRDRIRLHKEDVETRLAYIVEQATLLKKVYEDLIAKLEEIRKWANSPVLDKKVEEFRDNNTKLWDNDLPALINIVFFPLKFVYCCLSWIWGDACSLGGGGGEGKGEGTEGSNQKPQDGKEDGTKPQTGPDAKPSAGEVPGAKAEEFRSLPGLPSVDGPVKYRIGHDGNAPPDYILDIAIDKRLPPWRRLPFALRAYEKAGGPKRFGELAAGLDSQAIKSVSFNYPDVGEPWPFVMNLSLKTDSRPPHDWVLLWANLDAMPELLQYTSLPPVEGETVRSLPHRPPPSNTSKGILYGFEAVEKSSIVRLVFLPEGAVPIRLRFPATSSPDPEFTDATIRHLQVLTVRFGGAAQGMFPVEVKFELNGPGAARSATPQKFMITWDSSEMAHFGAGSPSGK